MNFTSKEQEPILTWNKKITSIFFVYFSVLIISPIIILLVRNATVTIQVFSLNLGKPIVSSKATLQFTYL